jgi:hypothetical protein
LQQVGGQFCTISSDSSLYHWDKGRRVSDAELEAHSDRRRSVLCSEVNDNGGRAWQLVLPLPFGSLAFGHYDEVNYASHNLFFVLGIYGLYTISAFAISSI